LVLGLGIFGAAAGQQTYPHPHKGDVAVNLGYAIAGTEHDNKDDYNASLQVWLADDTSLRLQATLLDDLDLDLYGLSLTPHRGHFYFPIGLSYFDGGGSSSPVPDSPSALLSVEHGGCHNEHCEPPPSPAERTDDVEEWGVHAGVGTGIWFNDYVGFAIEGQLIYLLDEVFGEELYYQAAGNLRFRLPYKGK
jgi:hypothetical protein